MAVDSAAGREVIDGERMKKSTRTHLYEARDSILGALAGISGWASTDVKRDACDRERVVNLKAALTSLHEALCEPDEHDELRG